MLTLHTRAQTRTRIQTEHFNAVCTLVQSHIRPLEAGTSHMYVHKSCESYGDNY